MTELEPILSFVTSEEFIAILPEVVGGVAALVAAPSLLGKVAAGLRLSAKIRKIREKIRKRRGDGK